MLLTILQNSKHLCWSLFLIKLQAWWCAILSRQKTLAQVNSKCFQKFLEDLLCRTCLNRYLSEISQKAVSTKSIYRKTPLMTSFLVQLQRCGLKSFPKGTSSQMFFYENCEVLQNINFTEQCCATASGFFWHFQCITFFISDKSVQSYIAWRYNISIISVLI